MTTVYTSADQESTKTDKIYRIPPAALRIAVIMIRVLIAFAWYLHEKEYAEYFSDRKGSIINAETKDAGNDSVFTKSWLTLESRSGLKIDCGMLVPRGQGRFPAIIVLGGKATGKYAIDYVFDVSNTIIVAVDYPFEPRSSYSIMSFLSVVPEMRNALIDMIPSVMLLTDYLSARPNVDSTRIILLGYSFGAPLVPAIIANDKRPAVAIMVHGGGDIYGLISHNVRRYKGPVVSDIVAGLGALLLRPIEPMRYAAALSPVPLLMINGTDDEQIPRVNAETLFEAAGNPKKIIWLESRHVNPSNEELTGKIIGVLKEELVAMGIGDFN